MLCAVGEGEERGDEKDGQPPVSNDSGSQGGPKREPSSAASVMMQPGILAGGFMSSLRPPAFLHGAHSCFHRHREPATFLTGGLPHSPITFFLSSQPASPFPFFLSSQPASQSLFSSFPHRQPAPFHTGSLAPYPFPHRQPGPLPLSISAVWPLTPFHTGSLALYPFPHRQPAPFHTGSLAPILTGSQPVSPTASQLD